MNENNFQEFKQEESFDIKAFLFKIFNYWYFFAMTIILALVIAFLFNKYSKPIYKVSTKVLIEDDQSNGTLNPDAVLGFGLLRNQANIENEIGILKSFTLINRTIEELDFFVSYYFEEQFITNELYTNIPFKVVFDTSFLQPLSVKFYLNILSGNEFNLLAEGENISLYNYSKNKEKGVLENIKIDKKYNFGETITDDENYNFKIIKNNGFDASNTEGKYYFLFNDINSLTRQYSSFEIEPINREATIVEIALRGNNKEKSVNFLNKFAETYIARSLEKKNQTAINTINFIDSQLGEITDSLTTAESHLEDFRTNKQVMNLDFQAQQVFEYMKKLEEEKAILVVKSKYYDYLYNYLRDNNELDEIVVPSTWE